MLHYLPTYMYLLTYRAGHILSRIYNCTKPGNRPINHRFDKNLFTS